MGKFKGFQEAQVQAHLTIRRPIFERGDNLPHRQAVRRFVEHRQNGALPFGDRALNPFRRNIAPWSEAHRHAAAALFDVRPGQIRLRRDLGHLDGTPSPCLDDAAAIEHPCDQRVPRKRFVGLEQLLGRQIEVQGTRRRDFEPIVVDADGDGTAANGVIPMAKRVRQGFPHRHRRIERFIDPLHAPRHHTAGDGIVFAQKSLRAGQQRERVTVHLPVVDELRAPNAAKPRHAQHALRKLGRHARLGAEEHHRRPRQPTIPQQAQAAQQALDVARPRVLQTTSADRILDGSLHRGCVQIRHAPTRRRLVFPPLLGVQPLQQQGVVGRGRQCLVRIADSPVPLLFEGVGSGRAGAHRDHDHLPALAHRNPFDGWQRGRIDFAQTLGDSLDGLRTDLLPDHSGRILGDAEQHTPASVVQHCAHGSCRRVELRRRFLELQRLRLAAGRQFDELFRRHEFPPPASRGGPGL